MMKRFSFLLALLALGTSNVPVRAGDAPAADVEFFEKKVRPLLVEQCFSCHGNGKTKGGLDASSRAGLLKGGDSGAAIVPGEPEKSLLIQAVKQTGELKMPPKSKLTPADTDALTQWIQRGAAWPATATTANGGLRTNGDVITVEERKFWSFQPITNPEPPAVKNATWVKKPLDRFVLAKLEAEGLRPVAPAEKRTLLRRVTFDLVGLPPTPEEVEDFVKDESPEAFAKVVDRLLASPHYGERWGRHWLDVARYAEDQAHTFQARLYPFGYRYRDWVAKAFNDDLPYDRFVVAQIAGDLLPDGTAEEKLPPLGFIALGPYYYRDAGEAKVAEAAELDDRIDTLTRGFLGLTVACARCHDHKFDPIPTKDYYSLAGVFKSTRYVETPLAPADVIARYNEHQEKLKAQEAKIKQHLDAESETLLRDTARYLVATWKLQNLRRSKPQTSAKEIAKDEKLHDFVLDRLVKYLADKSPRPHLDEWNKTLANLDDKKDLSGDDKALSLVKQAAAAVQARVLDILKRRDELVQKKREKEPNASLDKLRADAVAELKAPWLADFAGAPKSVFALTDKQAETVLTGPAKQILATLKTELEQIKKAAPPKPPMVHTQAEDKPGDMKVFMRGNPNKEGDVAPRRFLRILAGDNPPLFTQGSGRLELARAIASKDNPLTARVMVNRVWQHHFGRGLVGTPSNFGTLGERPTHPELLDHLTSFFLSNGWGLKKLHREILLSATYQLSAAHDPANEQKDAANRLLWHANRRRLDAEAWRDSLLSVTGNLDLTLGGPSADLNNTGNRRRTLYGSVSRHSLNSTLRLFDFPDPNLTSESRPTTIVPLQQLFVLNSPFMHEQAKTLAKRLQGAGADDAERIRTAYLRLYGRAAREREVELGLAFLKLPETTEPGETKPALSRWEQYAQVLLSANEFSFVD
jgi:cytochrome c553